MARKTFFSFHYMPDCWRAGQIRNSWVTKDRVAAGFFDSAKWQEVKKLSDPVIGKWIDEQMFGTSVTVVLIGSSTAGRKWINYEIKSSYKRGNGLLGIYVHNMKNSDGKTSNKGQNPFDGFSIKLNGVEVKFSALFKTYDWVLDNGYVNMGKWIEDAAKSAGR